MWYSETFIFLLAGTCMGATLTFLGALGCFLLAIFGKDESVGEVKIGKFFSVKGVSLIMVSVCGVALMGVCVYAWIQTRGDSRDDFLLDDMGYYDTPWEWEEDAHYPPTEGDAMWAESLGYFDDDDSAGEVPE